jgi:hypothetical protein
MNHLMTEKLADREQKLRDMQFERHRQVIDHSAVDCYYCFNQGEFEKEENRKKQEIELEETRWKQQIAETARKAAIESEKKSTAEKYESMCKSYFTDAVVLDEFRVSLKATTSTAKERFARRFCRWLMDSDEINIPLTSEGNIMLAGIISMKKSVPPQLNEIAALYKMITSAPLEDRQLSASVEYSLGDGPVSDIYQTWRSIAREDRRSFPTGMLPTKTCLRWDRGGVYQWGTGDNMFVVDHDGLLVKNPHETAYNAGNNAFNLPADVEKLVEWAYSIEPERPPKYVAMFLNRKVAEGLTMKDALEHAYAENWGIVSAILRKHHFTDREDKKVWDRILECNVDSVNDRLKSMECAIMQFSRGYKMDSFYIWMNCLRYAMFDNDDRAVCRLMQVADYHGYPPIDPRKVAYSVVQRYKNMPSYCLRRDIEKFTVRHIFNLVMRYSDSDEDRSEKKKALVEAILEEMKDEELSDKNALGWLKKLVETPLESE